MIKQFILLGLVAMSFFLFRKLFFFIFTDHKKTKNQQNKSDDIEEKLKELKTNKIKNKDEIKKLTKEQIDLNLKFVDRTWFISLILMIFYMFIFSQLTFLDQLELFGYDIPWFIAYLIFTFVISIIYEKIMGLIK